MLRNCTLHLEFMLLRLVPGAGVEPARRNYPSRDFKSLVSTSFTTRADPMRNCVRKKLEAGVRIEPASTALQAKNALKPNNDLQRDSY